MNAVGIFPNDDGHENELPECQGCKKREAQFVCADCQRQWYCSRECQVQFRIHFQLSVQLFMFIKFMCSRLWLGMNIPRCARDRIIKCRSLRKPYLNDQTMLHNIYILTSNLLQIHKLNVQTKQSSFYILPAVILFRLYSIMGLLHFHTQNNGVVKIKE